MMSRYTYIGLLNYFKKSTTFISRCHIENKLPFAIRSAGNLPADSSETYVDIKENRSLFNKHGNVQDAIPRGDADIFGNLSAEWKLEKRMDSMPEEEDDLIRYEFKDGKIGKRRLSTKQYADMIKNYLANKKLIEALDVLEVQMIKEDKVQPENYIYNLLIDGCAKVGYTKKAFKLYNDMKKRGLKVTGATYTSLFNACALSPIAGDGIKRALHLRDIINEKQVELNRSNYHAMMKAFGRCGDIMTVFSIVDEMASKNRPLKPDTFSFLLQACIADNGDGFRHAIMVWQKMRERGVKPTIFCYNLMIRSARDCGLGDYQLLNQDLQRTSNVKQIEDGQKLIAAEFNEAMTYLPGVTNRTTVPMSLPNLLATKAEMGSVVSVRTIIKPKHRLMLLGGSGGLLKQMEYDGVKPDVKTATILLDLIPSTSQFELDLISQLEKAGVDFDIDFFNMLIKKRCFRKDYFSARDVMRLISERRLRPTLMTFGVLSLSCRNTKDTLQFLQDLTDFGFRPNMEILGGLLCAARHSWNVDMVLKIMNIVTKEELKVSKVFYRHLEKFRDFTAKQIDQKNQGLQYHDMIDNSAFMESYNGFLSKFKIWSKVIEIEDRDTVHPWKQFKKPRSDQNQIENYQHV